MFPMRLAFPVTMFLSLVSCGSSTNQGGTGLGDSGDVTLARDAESKEIAPPVFDSPVFDVPVIEASANPPDGNCGGQHAIATAREVSILLVVDTSASMAQKPFGFGGLTKWDALQTALVGTSSAPGSLENIKARASLGLEMFPYSALGISNPCGSVDCCAVAQGAMAINVPIEPGATALPKIAATLAGYSPAGATPTADALRRAHDYFTTGAGKDLTGDRFVILATDGGPNCNTALTSCDIQHCTRNLDGNACPPGADAGADAASVSCCDPSRTKIDCLDDASVTAELSLLRDTANVRTLVVGIPGSEAYKVWLDEFAVAGGYPNGVGADQYFAVESTATVSGLKDAFDLVTGKLITQCRYALASMPPDVGKVNVLVNKQPVVQSGANGWEYDKTTSPWTVVLKGTTCATIQSQGAKTVDIEFGCETIK